MSPAPIPDLTGATDARATLARALALRPRTIPPRWLYDDRGSELFDAITRLPEYYQTEAEREILAEHATRIAEAHRCHDGDRTRLRNERQDPRPARCVRGAWRRSNGSSRST